LSQQGKAVFIFRIPVYRPRILMCKRCAIQQSRPQCMDKPTSLQEWK
jgi:hypothetical protein